jgi:hypothetical protein
MTVALEGRIQTIEHAPAVTDAVLPSGRPSRFQATGVAFPREGRRPSARGRHAAPRSAVARPRSDAGVYPADPASGAS